jgi:hypothetical protein
MGLSITAACQCGFHSGPMLTGGGMLNYETTNYHPCLCRRCRGIVPCNIKETPVQCFGCGANAIPYGSADSESNFTDADLWNGQHECPQCGKQTLQFQMGLICWD